MNKNLVSIIIPVYNRSKVLYKNFNYFRSSLLLLENLSCPVEILVIDDFSDQPLDYDLLRVGFSDFISVRLIRNISNRGVSFSRNVGLRSANGKWIFFLDSDDIFDFGRFIISHYNYLVKDDFDYLILEKILVRFRKSEFALVFNSANWNSRDFAREFYLKRNSNAVYSQISMFIFRKDFLDNVNLTFREILRNSEDTEFKMNLLNKNGVYFTLYSENIYLSKIEDNNSLGKIISLNNRMYKIISALFVLFKFRGFVISYYLVNYISYQIKCILKYSLKKIYEKLKKISR